MKLDEVANTKIRCGLIMAAGGNESVNASDWHGSTEVYTNKTAFFKAIQNHFVEWHRATTDEDDEEALAQIRSAKTIDALADHDDWESFLANIWIDDRF